MLSNDCCAWIMFYLHRERTSFPAGSSMLDWSLFRLFVNFRDTLNISLAAKEMVGNGGRTWRPRGGTKGVVGSGTNDLDKPQTMSHDIPAPFLWAKNWDANLSCDKFPPRVTPYPFVVIDHCVTTRRPFLEVSSQLQWPKPSFYCCRKTKWFQFQKFHETRKASLFGVHGLVLCNCISVLSFEGKLQLWFSCRPVYHCNVTHHHEHCSSWVPAQHTSAACLSPALPVTVQHQHWAENGFKKVKMIHFHNCAAAPSRLAGSEYKLQKAKQYFS